MGMAAVRFQLVLVPPRAQELKLGKAVQLYEGRGAVALEEGSAGEVAFLLEVNRPGFTGEGLVQ